MKTECDDCNIRVKCVTLKGTVCPKRFPYLYGLKKNK